MGLGLGFEFGPQKIRDLSIVVSSVRDVGWSGRQAGCLKTTVVLIVELTLERNFAIFCNGHVLLNSLCLNSGFYFWQFISVAWNFTWIRPMKVKIITIFIICFRYRYFNSVNLNFGNDALWDLTTLDWKFHNRH